MGWSVGNGASISVWNDPWLSPELPLRPMGPPTYENRNLCVADLISPLSNAWNLQAVRQPLPQYEELILQIIPSSFNKADEHVWLHDKTGTYSAKSGYATSRLEAQPQNQDTFPWKKCIWNLNSSPKVQTFLWKAMSGALPVGYQLQIRGLQADPRSKRCGVLETPLHLFLNCPFAAQVWQEIPALFKPSPETTSSLSELLLSNTRMVNLPPTGLASTPIYPWLYWHLWKNRNSVIFEDRAWSAPELAVKILQDARSWEEANSNLRHQSSQPCRPPAHELTPTPQDSIASLMEHGRILHRVRVDMAVFSLHRKVPPLCITLQTAYTLLLHW